MLACLIVVPGAGCGAGAVEAPSVAAAEAAGPPARVIVLAPSRDLSPQDPFAALVRAARVFADEAGEAPGERCLLGGAGPRLALEGDLAFGVSPLPEPASGLRPALDASEHLGLLTRFGSFGDGPLLLATFTPAPPPSLTGAVALVLTGQGAYVRTTGPSHPAVGGAPVGPVPLSDALDALAALVAAGLSPVVVTAEASLPIATVAEALRGLSPLGAPVALAVALEPGTRAPAPAAPAAPTDCALPPAPSAPGRLAPEQATAALAPLGALVRRCRRSASSPGAARGGLLRLMLEVGPDGSVAESCVADEALEVADPTLARCIAAAARGLRFSVPEPPGTVRLAVPLRLRRDVSFDRVGWCGG